MAGMVFIVLAAVSLARVAPLVVMARHCEKCSPDGYRCSHLAGTIFENTNKPLKDWFRVVHMMLVSKKGMSALQIYRYLGFGSYKTAWLMCAMRFRTALVEDIGHRGGRVEGPETLSRRQRTRPA